MNQTPSCYSLLSNDYLITTALQRDYLTPLENELLIRLESAMQIIKAKPEDVQ